MLKAWDEKRRLEDLCFDYAAFHIQIYGLAPNQMKLGNARRIGDFGKSRGC